MARGKFASRAEAQSAFKAVADDREAQRGAIVRLTAEKKALQDELRRIKEANTNERRKMLAQINHGTSDALEAARRMIEDERERAAKYKRELDMQERRNYGSVQALFAFVSNKYGVTAEEFIGAFSADPAGAAQWQRDTNRLMASALADRGRGRI